jgi:hypothetical protein
MCRFVDASTNAVIDKAANMTKMTNYEQKCIAPKTDSVADARVEISANGQQWQDTQHSITFYNGPKVTSLNPTYGVTKNPKGTKLEITGDNFKCPANDCSKLRVRFTNDQGDEIYTDGKLSDSGTITTPIPKYPAPETLNVDVSFNDQDYTNDNVKYGFMDPFILQV